MWYEPRLHSVAVLRWHMDNWHRLHGVLHSYTAASENTCVWALMRLTELSFVYLSPWQLAVYWLNKNNMFVCDISGLNHNYAFVSQHSVNQTRGRVGGWCVKQALVLILSHFVVFVCVVFYLTLTLSQSKKERGRRSYWNELDSFRNHQTSCRSCLPLSWESAGTPFVVVFYCCFP